MLLFNCDFSVSYAHDQCYIYLVEENRWVLGAAMPQPRALSGYASGPDWGLVVVGGYSE